ALAQPPVLQPGDTLWLRGGRYPGDFTSALTGTPALPLLLRQYPGERATIDGSLTLNGAYTWYWGFEVMNSDPLRVSSQPDSDPTDIPRQARQLAVFGPGTKCINLVVHDLGDGIGAWSQATGAELTGCLTYNNGWQGPDRGHGH